jgi:YesN/AraC family two-component response regulator
MKVLLIEDEALIGHNLKFTLEEKGLQVIMSYNYNQGLQEIDKGDFDIMVTDINLDATDKEKNGVNLIRHLRKNSSKPVIVLTAFSNDELIEEAIGLKIDNYLVKPINPITLYASLKMIINNLTTAIEENTKDFLFVKIGSKFVKVNISEIYYLGATKNYVVIRVFDNAVDLPYRGSLQDFFDKYIPDQSKKDYIRLSRGEIILKSIVTKIHKSYVETNYGNFKLSLGINVKDFE